MNLRNNYYFVFRKSYHIKMETKPIKKTIGVPDCLECDHMNIKTERGLQNFLRTIYAYSGLTACYSISLAQLMFSIAIQYVNLFIFGGFVGSVLFGELLNRQKGKLVKTRDGYEMRHSFLKLLTYLAAAASFSCMLSPFVGLVNIKDPSILPMACFLTFMLSGMSVLSSRVLSWMGIRLKIYHNGLILGLYGLLLISFFAMVSGNPELNSVAYNMNTYIGLAVFVGLHITSTSLAIDAYNDANLDHLVISYGFFTGIMNIFIRVVSILSGGSGNPRRRKRRNH